MDNTTIKDMTAKKSKTKNLVLTVVNGVAKWVDPSEATERFSGLRQERLTRRYISERNPSKYAEELE